MNAAYPVRRHPSNFPLLLLLAAMVLAAVPLINLVSPYVRNKSQEFTQYTKRECLKKSAGRDMITGDKLQDGYQFHHIQPISQGGRGTLDNCLVVNLDTHNALHTIMSNGRFSLQKYYKDRVINALSQENMKKLAEFLTEKGWRFDHGYWTSPWE